MRLTLRPLSSAVMEFSAPDVARLYSQLTGVLAGFSFTGLVLVLTQKLTSAPSSTVVDFVDPPIDAAGLSAAAVNASPNGVTKHQHSIVP